MPPADAPGSLREQQVRLTRHLRDPDGQPAPDGIEERRLQVYRDLLYNNLTSLLAGNFPVIRKLLGDGGWAALVRAFYRDHRCQTPLFPEVPREFLRYLEATPGITPPFLPELAHYEWVELALQIHEASASGGGDASASDADLLDGPLAVSSLAWPLAYRWPVHRIGPGFQPDAPPPQPTLLLLRREPDGSVRFSELSPLAWRLLERIGGSPDRSGRDHLQALAMEAQADNRDGFLAQGTALLRQMHAVGVIHPRVAGPA